jgi:hypothetical protein
MFSPRMLVTSLPQCIRLGPSPSLPEASGSDVGAAIASHDLHLLCKSRRETPQANSPHPSGPPPCFVHNRLTHDAAIGPAPAVVENRCVFCGLARRLDAKGGGIRVLHLGPRWMRLDAQRSRRFRGRGRSGAASRTRRRAHGCASRARAERRARRSAREERPPRTSKPARARAGRRNRGRKVRTAGSAGMRGRTTTDSTHAPRGSTARPSRDARAPPSARAGSAARWC